MPQETEQLDLSQCGLPENFVIIRLLKLLDSHHLPALLVATSKHHAIRAFPHDSQHLVFIHLGSSRSSDADLFSILGGLKPASFLSLSNKFRHAIRLSQPRTQGSSNSKIFVWDIRWPHTSSLVVQNAPNTTILLASRHTMCSTSHKISPDVDYAEKSCRSGQMKREANS